MKNKSFSLKRGHKTFVESARTLAHKTKKAVINLLTLSGEAMMLKVEKW